MNMVYLRIATRDARGLVEADNIAQITTMGKTAG